MDVDRIIFILNNGRFNLENDSVILERPDIEGDMVFRAGKIEIKGRQSSDLVRMYRNGRHLRVDALDKFLREYKHDEIKIETDRMREVLNNSLRTRGKGQVTTDVVKKEDLR